MMRCTRGILSSILTLASLCSCLPPDPMPAPGNPARDCSNPGDFYLNPTYEYPRWDALEAANIGVEPIKQYPRASETSYSVSELEEFCTSIKEKFRCSHASHREAEDFLELLSQHLTIVDGSFGMPSPDFPSGGPVDLRERVLLRRISGTEWEIFYYKIGCGISYTYSRVLSDGTNLHIDPIERWSESYPC